MEEESQYKMTEISQSGYWIANTALHITLNAMGLPDYIQMNVSSGSVFACYLSTVKDLGFDAGHNYKRWPLSAFPTYLNSTTEKHVYVAVPRGGDTSQDAIVVFPSERVDLYGKNEKGDQIGSIKYYYIWLHATITSSLDENKVVMARSWLDNVEPDTGSLATEESFVQGGESTWWQWNSISNTISFIKDIANAVFNTITIGAGSLKKTINRILDSGDVDTTSMETDSAAGQDKSIVTAGFLNIFGNKHFIRKDIDDYTSNSLGVGKNLTVGDFQTGLTGSGAQIDQKGNGEFESGTFRTFMSAKSFLYNLIEVNINERWSTNGFCKIKAVDTVNRIIVEQLDENQYSTMAIGDGCRGIFSDLDNQYGFEDKAMDECGFPTRKGFFTSYFCVSKIISSGKGHCTFGYTLRNSATPHPCALMQAAQYFSFTNENRRSSQYSTNFPKSYFMSIDGVSTWEVQPQNRTTIIGWYDGMPVLNTDGSVYKLKEKGIYTQGNVYFGKAVIQLSPSTLEDLKKQLDNYVVSLTGYADNVTADAVGNIVGGLWFTDDKGNKQYRIHTAVSVRNNNDIITIADDDKDAEKGEYKLYVQGIGCTAELHNSTVYITGIDYFNDGLATVDDGTTHTDGWYNLMRKTNACAVNIIVNCEGKGSVVKTINIGITHTDEVYALADLDNEMSNIRFSLKDSAYKGFDSSATGVTIKHNNVSLPITDIRIGTLPDGVTVTKTISSDRLTYTVDFQCSLTEDTLTDFNVPITVVGVLAGVNYENTLYKKFNKVEGTATYELSPSTGSVGATYDANGNKVLSTDTISCGIKCYDDSGENYDLTSAQQTDRSLVLSYVVYDASGTSIKNGNASVGDKISLTSTSYKIVFTLSQNSKTIDEETIYVNADGKSSYTYIRFGTDENGSDIKTTSDDTHIYVGIYTGPLAQAPTDAKSYTWAKLKGDTGEGTPGANGYVHVAWCNTADNSDQSFVTSNPDGKEYAYIGTYTDNSQTDLEKFAAYDWIKVKGAKGEDAHLHIRFAPTDDVTKSDMVDTPSSTDKYIGLYSDNKTKDSDTKSDYKWGNFYGQDGTDYELVYALSVANSAPVKKMDKSDVTNSILGWWDDIQSVSESYPYLWVSKRIKTNGVWGDFASAKLFTRYAKDGANGDPGADGTNGEYKQTLYRFGITKPAVPVCGKVSELPNFSVEQPAWQQSLPDKDNDIDISYTDVVGNWTNDYVAYIKSPVTDNSKYSCLKITVVSKKDNALLAMLINVSSESNYDFGMVSNLDDSVSTSPSSLTSYKAKISGSVTDQALYFPIAKKGTHYIYVYYFKDGSGASGNDAFWLRCVVPSLYTSTAKATRPNNLTEYQFGIWSDVIELNPYPELPVSVSIEKNSYQPTSYNNVTGAATSDISDVNKIYLYAGTHKCTIDSITSDISSNIALLVSDVNTAKIVYSAASGTVISTQTYNITVTGKYNGIIYTAKAVYNVIVVLKGEKGDPGDPGDKGDKGQQGAFPRRHEKGALAGSYYAGKTIVDGVYPLDFVFYKADTTSGYNVYKCISDVTYTSVQTESSISSDTTHWSSVSSVDSSYFNWIIAKGASIDMLFGSAYYIRDNNGNITGKFGYGSSDTDYMLYLGASTAESSFFRVNSSGAYVNGEVVATKGKIGGFEIGDGRIGVTPSTTTVNGVTYQTQGNGNLVICKDFFRVGGSNAYVMFGDNVIPSTAGGAFTAAARIYNHAANTGGSYGLDQANYGLIVDVSGGTKNYAIYSDNSVGRFTAVYGTRMYKLNITSSTYIVDLSQNNVLYIYMSTSYTINLPNQSKLASQFGYSSLPDNFFYMFTIVAAYGTAAMKIADVKNRDWENVSIDISQGDALLIAAIYNGSTFVYKLINEYR